MDQIQFYRANASLRLFSALINTSNPEGQARIAVILQPCHDTAPFFRVDAGCQVAVCTPDRGREYNNQSEKNRANSGGHA